MRYLIISKAAENAEIALMCAHYVIHNTLPKIYMEDIYALMSSNG